MTLVDPASVYTGHPEMWQQEWGDKRDRTSHMWLPAGVPHTPCLPPPRPASLPQSKHLPTRRMGLDRRQTSEWGTH